MELISWELILCQVDLVGVDLVELIRWELILWELISREDTLLSPFLYIGWIEPRLQAFGKDSLDKIELYSVVRCATRDVN